MGTNKGMRHRKNAKKKQTSHRNKQLLINQISLKDKFFCEKKYKLHHTIMCDCCYGKLYVDKQRVKQRKEKNKTKRRKRNRDLKNKNKIY